MAISIYNDSSYSSKLVEVIRNSTNGLKIVDFVLGADSESQFANRYDSIPLKILTSFFYIIEVRPSEKWSSATKNQRRHETNTVGFESMS